MCRRLSGDSALLLVEFHGGIIAVRYGNGPDSCLERPGPSSQLPGINRSMDRMLLGFPDRGDHRLTVRSVPSGWRAAEVTSPCVRCLEIAKCAQPVAQVEDRHGRLRRERDDRAYPYPAREVLILPNGRVILERFRHDLQECDPPRDTGEVADQVVTRLHLLDGPPPTFSEAGHLPTGGSELLPRRSCEQVQPVVPRHESAPLADG